VASRFPNVTAFNIRQMTPIENPENVESKAQASERVWGLMNEITHFKTWEQLQLFFQAKQQALRLAAWVTDRQP